MKIIALGDTHGRDRWRHIAKKETFDKFIFIGDYFDTREGISSEMQKRNFQNIVDFKKANPSKVILLVGNHDFVYMKCASNERYSLFQPGQAKEIQKLLHEAIDHDLMQMCYVHNHFVFTHAGVTKTWCQNYNVDVSNLQDSINDLFKLRPKSFLFTPNSVFSGSGDDVTQSPIWVRPRSLYADKVPGYTYIVGHTTQDTITGLNGSRKFYDPRSETMIEASGVIFIDTLGTSGEYLQIIDGAISAKK